MQILLRPLIGPAALAVPGNLIRKAGVHGPPEIDRHNPRLQKFQFKPEPGALQLSLGGNGQEPAFDLRAILLAIVLNQKPESAIRGGHLQFPAAGERNAHLPHLLRRQQNLTHFASGNRKGSPVDRHTLPRWKRQRTMQRFHLDRHRKSGPEFQLETVLPDRSDRLRDIGGDLVDGHPGPYRHAVRRNRALPAAPPGVLDRRPGPGIAADHEHRVFNPETAVFGKTDRLRQYRRLRRRKHGEHGYDGNRSLV